ncbi:Transferase [Sesbania bispinosa]|nr:Transferase [Sesbania bispinosa]
MAEPIVHKLVEQCRVGPASPPDPTTNRTTTLPLTFLDLSLAGPVYVRRQFFYNYPYSTHHFYETTLPSLKRSLSLTLQHFFPLAGNLLCPPKPHKPFISCSADDSVTFTIIESAADFNHLSANHPKSLKEYSHLVAKLTYTMADDDMFIFPLVALQASIFPNHGLCIAITYCHVMDDNSCSHFMKTWSSIHRTGGVDLTKSPPCFDRKALKDPRGLEAVFLRDYFEERSTWKDKLIVQSQTSERANGDEDYVKATIVFSRDDIEKLKRRALNEWKKNDEFINAPQYLSKFVVTCAFVWVSLVKTRCRDYDDHQEESDHVKEEYFRFAADCRDRLEYPIPATYFGNCLTRCHAMLKRKDIKGEGGFLNAVRGIERAITDMKVEPFEGAENWKALFKKTFVLGSTVLVTGSPKFTVYETDFGFGRPVKVEMAHSFKCMSLAESGDKEGGLEFGLIFRSREFEYFISVIEEGLQATKS